MNLLKEQHENEKAALIVHYDGLLKAAADQAEGRRKQDHEWLLSHVDETMTGQDKHYSELFRNTSSRLAQTQQRLAALQAKQEHLQTALLHKIKLQETRYIDLRHAAEGRLADRERQLRAAAEELSVRQCAIDALQQQLADAARMQELQLESVCDRAQKVLAQREAALARRDLVVAQLTAQLAALKTSLKGVPVPTHRKKKKPKKQSDSDSDTDTECGDACEVVHKLHRRQQELRSGARSPAHKVKNSLSDSDSDCDSSDSGSTGDALTGAGDALSELPLSR
eukprot:TRINITY_DN3684_c0_g1_i1.p1 TRINITY_DN3684_c0_g1~~TRINITY_DN3684_c0_g1_i1.p1  ORF type:complete len:282 (-),score=87.86 TRINITY_DN3684_c0_g1_i1:162-1007(-)